jgi:hypothetical protein
MKAVSAESLDFIKRRPITITPTRTKMAPMIIFVLVFIALAPQVCSWSRVGSSGLPMITTGHSYVERIDPVPLARL